jgi:hypothetical protein
METKLVNSVFWSLYLVPANTVCPISAISTIPRATLVATFSNIIRHVCLCLQAEGHQFQYILQTNYHMYQGIYSPSLVSISK